MTALIGAVGVRNVAPLRVEGRSPVAQVSGEISVVHAGDIDNYRSVRAMLEAKGYAFRSAADSELAAHLIHHLRRKGGSLFDAVRTATALLDGFYALAVRAASEPDCLVAAHHGSPLVVGIAADGRLLASDSAALLPWTRDCIFLEDGDVAELRRADVRIADRRGALVRRTLRALPPATPPRSVRAL